ncbi:MAG: alpha-hydroxy-acid oxidizing enzyme, partial [Alphaproteobacteria bacterium]
LTPGQADQAGGVAAYINAQFDRSLTWKDAEWLAELWGGPFAIKGVMDPADAERAHEHGASAVMLSNHGGRQLDGACAPIEMVGRVRERVGDRLEVILDGGVRRGSHVVKALAAGADAVSIGRPYLYGLAGGGEAGVTRVLSLLIEETHRTLALLGCADIDRLDRSFLRDR